ncbi:hypothetical protein LWF15_17800 [Kineosporia rhizophila]|uniref:hypothetical protein n=1 Tax=Kineosporia TaxID=49184 RepID=UPI001E49D0DB|nr:MULTISPECIES: hypothetical protein [Kineosporia]MCE0537360.1 hypothetical protein [Kineosporia rhizophila]GLY17493.1 hypothetical protein Kisp01_45070 [Kineosporia sp. NBRC 101677]
MTETPSILVLTEVALSDEDALRLTSVHADDESGRPAYHLLVPADVERNLLADVLDHLSLFQLREALEAVRGEDEPTRTEAADALARSLAAFSRAGWTATGEVIEGDPVKVLQQHSADEVIVVTRPHAVEDTFHTDWASRAREALGVPVLHVYAGSSFLG